MSSTEFTFKSDGTKPGAPVVTFKPATSVSATSALHSQKNDVAPNVTVKPFAVAPTPGTIPAFAPAPVPGADGNLENQKCKSVPGPSGSSFSEGSSLFSSISKPAASTTASSGFNVAPKATLTTAPATSDFSFSLVGAPFSFAPASQAFAKPTVTTAPASFSFGQELATTVGSGASEAPPNAVAPIVSVPVDSKSTGDVGKTSAPINRNLFGASLPQNHESGEQGTLVVRSIYIIFIFIIIIIFIFINIVIIIIIILE